MRFSLLVVSSALLVIAARPARAVAAVDVEVRTFTSRVVGNVVTFDMTMCATGTGPTTFDVHLWGHRAAAPSCTTTPDASAQLTLTGTSCISFTEVVPNVSQGTFTSWLSVDGACKLAETNETNNTRSTVSRVGVDVSVKTVTATVTGTTVAIDFTICSASASPVTTTIGMWAHRSKAPTCTTAPDASAPITLPANGCISDRVTASLAISPYTSWFAVDPACTVSELDETNNQKKVDYNIGGEHEAARAECVRIVNGYRAINSLSPLTHNSSTNACVDSEARDDQLSGKIHGTYPRCSEASQNACLNWTDKDLVTYVRACLGVWYDEGPGADPKIHGHYNEMMWPTYKRVNCGFATVPHAPGLFRGTIVMDFWY